MSGPKAPLRGTFVVSWGQTTIEGQTPGGRDDILAHRTWTWTGDPVCLAAGGGRPESDDAHALCASAARTARVILARALEVETRGSVATDACRDFAFTVTDGIRFWTVALIEFAELPRPVLVFAGEAPPPDRRLVVSEAPKMLDAMPAQGERRRGTVCFTPGTLIETDTGRRAIEDLVAGNRVMTRDDGAQEILWVGTRRITGARLHAYPDLRPVRIREGAVGEGRPDGDLIVSPDHRILLTGARAQAVWGEPEVLIAARDLIDDQGVTRAHELREVTYVHLLLASHQVLIANGTPAESFHPADADLDMVLPDQRARLFDVMPGVELDPASYGTRARQVISGVEAAILRGIGQA